MSSGIDLSIQDHIGTSLMTIHEDGSAIDVHGANITNVNEIIFDTPNITSSLKLQEKTYSLGDTSVENTPHMIIENTAGTAPAGIS